MKRSNRWERSASALGIVVAVMIAAGPAGHVQAHGTEARYVDFVNWPKENINRIFGTNRTYFDGAEGGRNKPIQTVSVEGKSCLMGDIIAFDISDKFAFDIDEPVKLTLTYATAYTTPFVVGWDKSGGTGQGLTPEVAPTGTTFGSVTLTLDRARFAGQGTQGSDVAIATKNGIALCDVKIDRSNTTHAPTEFGQVQLSIKDVKTGGLVPARVGIYDSTGRSPLVSDKALMLQRFADDLRMLSVNERTFWPSENRQAFYADGSYQGKLPEGTYELVATRGPEFRAYHGKFEVKKNQISKVTISLERYADLPKLGWYSGDAHIHLTRDEVADPVIWGMVAAEDVYVGNLLEMGNIAGTHFKQPKEWGKASRFERDGHFIVSGQEDPRTTQMGHTIHHNLQQPIHLPTDQYFLYNKVFEQSKQQGGISGFAHMGWTAGNTTNNPSAIGQMNRGLVMLAPTGMVNFIEVLQKGRMLMDGWYRLLNIGYHINPAAGSDWPYSDFPGVVRNYVKLDGPLNLDNWFASFKAGHTYVTNGPLLDFTVNGRGMGEELHVKKGSKLDIVANAQLNPDVDKLDRLDLVVLGDVAQTQAAQGKDRISLRPQLTADHSMWIAVRAYGSRQEPANTIIAHSAPIYVVVDDEPTWKREDVPTIVEELRGRLQRILTDPLDGSAGIGEASPNADADRFETRMMLDTQWLLQRPLLKPQVDAADASYQKLLDLWSKFSGVSPAAKAGT